MTSSRIFLTLLVMVSLIISPSFSSDAKVTELPSLAKLVKELKPTVVNISTTKLVRSPLEELFKDFRGFPDFFGEEFFKKFFRNRDPKEFKQTSLGSGFIIDKEGYILTNNHVIEKADEIKVKLSDKRMFDAQVVGRDPKTDLALIKVEADDDLPAARLGDSDELEVGEWVVAIGNPFGLEHTVTAGIISAKGRVIGAGPYDDFLQTDASINFGNSGGPLFNLKGEVVGINTAIVAGGQGIGFAIPSKMAKRRLPQLKKGRVVYGYLGVYIQDLTPELARSFGLKEPEGVLVSELIADSPAEQSGLQKGDVILKYDGQDVENTYQFRKMVGDTPHKKVKIVVLRKGKHKTLSVTTGELKEEKKVAAIEPGEIDRWGLKVQDITPDMAAHLGVSDDEGVVVTEVEAESPAQEAGLSGGDIVIEVEHQRVKNIKDYREYLGRYKGKETLLLSVRKKAYNYHTLFVVLKKKG